MVQVNQRYALMRIFNHFTPVTSLGGIHQSWVYFVWVRVRVIGLVPSMVKNTAMLDTPSLLELSSVRVLHIKLIFPPIYVQHDQRPCRRLIERRALWSQNYDTEIHLANTARVIWPCNANRNKHAGKKQTYAKPAHQTICSKDEHKKKR